MIIYNLYAGGLKIQGFCRQETAESNLLKLKKQLYFIRFEGKSAGRKRFSYLSWILEYKSHRDIKIEGEINQIVFTDEEDLQKKKCMANVILRVLLIEFRVVCIEGSCEKSSAVKSNTRKLQGKGFHSIFSRTCTVPSVFRIMSLSFKRPPVNKKLSS